MNFGKNKVEERADKFESAATYRKYKFRLMGIRVLFILVILCAGAGISAVAGTLKSVLDATPKPDEIQLVPQGYTTVIKDSRGNTVQTLIGENANREYVSLAKIPSHLQNAFISVEDERFYEHEGIDFQGIARALVNGLRNGGNFSQGSSTLTQQLLKNQVFGGGEERSSVARLERKIQEQYLALQVERLYTKQQLLEYYLNTINLGQNTLGVQAAAKRYFGKDVSDLTLSECAVIAGIAKNPTSYNPLLHPVKNRERRTIVLTSMKEQGYITNEDYNEAIQDSVYKRIRHVNKSPLHASESATTYFTDALIEQVVNDLKELGYTETQAYNTLYSRGLTIHTTQDTEIQAACDSIINNEKYYPKDSAFQLNYQLVVQNENGTEDTYDFSTMQAWYASRGEKLPDLYRDKKTAEKQVAAYRLAMVGRTGKAVTESKSYMIQPQVSFVILDQYTGQVKALCGGRGEKTSSRTLNRATGTTRQPGSTFDVLSAYLPALDTAGMSLATVHNDTEFKYPDTKRRVKNWYDGYRGLEPIRTAISDSMNVIAVKTLQEVTPKVAYDYLLRLKFTTLVDHYTDSAGNAYTDIALPLALGNLTKGVSNLELTNAFASIASGGAYRRPVFYTKVIDHDGNVLLDNTDNPATRVMKDSTAWLLTDAMQDVVTKGTGTELKFRGSNTSEAGKTGTSTENRDLWFVGYTPSLTAGIWCGYDSSIPQTSDDYHKPIWRDIMEALDSSSGSQKTSFAKPNSVTSALICTKCGKLAIDGLCSLAVGGSCARREFFAKDNVPTEACDCHVKCRICKSSGALAGDNCPAENTYTAIYLQKEEPSPDSEDSPNKIETDDDSLMMPTALKNSHCNVHNQTAIGS